MTTAPTQLPGTIPALLSSRAAATPDKPFIVDGTVTLTYGETEEQAKALAEKENLALLLVFKEGDGFIEYQSPAFQQIVTIIN